MSASQSRSFSAPLFVLALTTFITIFPSTAKAQHPQTFDPNSGPALRWEGSFGDVASLTGNKTTTIGLTGWVARGGLPVAFAVVHNSFSSHNAELGQKWTHSYDLYLSVDPMGDVTVHGGDDGIGKFFKNQD